MDDPQFIRTISLAVLEQETNVPRFETFCRGVVSELEGGAPIVSTSTSWDLGRDGVGLGVARGIYVCCSLRDDVDIKAISDIERITSTTRGIQRLYFCSSQNLSEYRLAQIQEELEKELDRKFPVICLGALQLRDVGLSHGDMLRRQYAAEIADCLSGLLPVWRTPC
jgi:hypothetical protein